MNFDYFADVNEQLSSLLGPIVEIDAKIKNLKHSSGSKEEAKKEKEKLKKERKQLWEKKWDEAYKLTPYFESHWKLLSSVYFEKENTP